MDRYPYHEYTILLGATRTHAHIGMHFTHRVFGLSDANMFHKLKTELSKTFNMKDLGNAKKILGIYEKSKSVFSPLVIHFKLSKRLCPSMKKDKGEMSVIPYSLAVGILMNAMVCTCPDISHAIGVVSIFLTNHGKAHWEAVKSIFRYLKGMFKLGGIKTIS